MWPVRMLAEVASTHMQVEVCPSLHIMQLASSFDGG